MTWMKTSFSLVLIASAFACSAESAAPIADPPANGSGGDAPPSTPDVSPPVVGGGGEPTPLPDPKCEITSDAMTTVAMRGGNTPVLGRKGYDYAPAIIKDGATYRMWWCGGIAGDHILHSEATSLSGPWSTPVDVFQPTGNASDFDGTHTCDPSVIRVGGTWYLYYGGFPNTGPASADVTRIGVATSSDGLTWTRANAGKAIVVPAASAASKPNKYGAGQPSIAYVDGKFVLAYTDTTAPGGNQVNGAGIYVLRSADPTFQTGVEELGKNGFAPYSVATHGAYPIVEAFSIDWAFSVEFDAFILARASSPDGKPTEIMLHAFDRALPTARGTLPIAATWAEGPGLVTTPDRRTLPGPSCGTIPFDIVRPVGGADPTTWDLAHVGVDVQLLGARRAQ